MASLAFQPFVDKENAGSIGVRPNKGQAGGGLGGLGKVFNKGNDLVTPRRALGDVGNKTANKGPSLQPMQKPSIPLQNKGLQMKSVNIQPLSNRSANIQKPTVNESLKKKVVCSSKVPVKVEPVNCKISEIEDIEHMHIPETEEDDFEDIWPKSERISTYIKKLVNWRPPCIFGDLPDSEEEDSEESEQKKGSEELNRRLEESVAKYSIGNSELTPDDIPELQLEPEDFEVPLPCFSLDNSLDLIPNIGTLELIE